MQSPTIRATQHLLVQGFELMPCAAAVCSRLVARGLLDDAARPWAIICGPDAVEWTAMLADDDPLRAALGEAAIRGSDPKTPHVVCHSQGGFLVVPLIVVDVRDARMRIETAVTLQLAPPVERLESFPDELIEREALRRAKRKGQGASGENTAQAKL